MTRPAAERLHPVLVVDDEVEVCTFFRHLLVPEQYEVTTARTVADALAAFIPGRYELALVDIKLPDGDGLSVLRAIRDSDPSCRVVVMTGYSTVRAAIEAIRLGAYDYLEKPFDDIYSLEKSIAAACAGERRASGWAQVSSRLDLIVGANAAMVGLMQVAEKIARRVPRGRGAGGPLPRRPPVQARCCVNESPSAARAARRPPGVP